MSLRCARKSPPYGIIGSDPFRVRADDDPARNIRDTSEPMAGISTVRREAGGGPGRGGP
jgi:hypothetical protein